VKELRVYNRYFTFVYLQLEESSVAPDSR